MTKNINKKLNKLFYQASAFLFTSLIFSSAAFAGKGGAATITGTSTIGGGGVKFLNEILTFLQGPIVQFAGIVAIVVAVVMFVIGEGQGWFKKGMTIVIPLVVFTNIGTILGALGISVAGGLI